MTTTDINGLASLNGVLYTQNIASPSNYVNAGWYYHNSGYIIQVGSEGIVNATMYQCGQDGQCGNGVIN